MRTILEALHFDRSSFGFAKPDHWSTCCLCNFIGHPTAKLAYIEVRTISSWGRWSDRYLCKDCSRQAAKCLPKLSTLLNSPDALTATLTPLERAIFQVANGEIRLSVAEILERLRSQGDKHTAGCQVSDACDELVQSRVLERYQSKPGTVRYFSLHPSMQLEMAA